jgi:hypothetical protein
VENTTKAMMSVLLTILPLAMTRKIKGKKIRKNIQILGYYFNN